MDEDTEYLQPNFDPTTLRVADLRRILLFHDVDFPSSAKKGQLVNLFLDHITPKAKAILQKKSRVRPSSKGIIKVEMDENGEVQPQIYLPEEEAARSSPRKRKSTAAVGVTDTPAKAPARTPRKSSTKTPLRVLPTPSDDEPEEVPKLRAIKPKKIDEPMYFSDDNVFQSGSAENSPSFARPDRRITGGRKSSAKSTASRRGTGALDTPDSEMPPPTPYKSYKPQPEESHRKSYMPPISDLRTSQTFHDVLSPSFGENEAGSVEAGEEFAPSADVDEIPAKSHRKSGQAKGRQKSYGDDISDAQLFFWCFLVILSGFYLMFWRQEKFIVGFCGVPQSEPSMADLVNEHYPNDWRSTFFNTIRPSCTPCPPHAICLPNLEMRCNKDFIYKPHPFRLNGALPLAGECIPDTEKQRRIAIVAERALNVLRDKAARVECEDETPFGITEREIKAELLKFKSGSLSDEEFDALFEAAIGEVEKREEVTVSPSPDGTGSKERRVFQSSNLAHVPWRCKLRKGILRSLGRHREKLIGGIIALAAVFYAYIKVISFQRANQLAGPLSRSIFRRLAAHRREYPDNPYLSITHLRDELLESLPTKERSAVWNRVKKVVEGNSNVRAGGGEVRGDFHRTWEWVGDLGAFRGEEILSPSPHYARMEQIRGDQDWSPSITRSFA